MSNQLSHYWVWHRFHQQRRRRDNGLAWSKRHQLWYRDALFRFWFAYVYIGVYEHIGSGMYGNGYYGGECGENHGEWFKRRVDWDLHYGNRQRRNLMELRTSSELGKTPQDGKLAQPKFWKSSFSCYVRRSWTGCMISQLKMNTERSSQNDPS